MSGEDDPEALRFNFELSGLGEWSDVSPDVPAQRDVLPDGRESIVIGEVEECKEFNHPQGDNPFGFRNTCGLVACEDLLRQFGVDVTEGDIVRFAVANGLCQVSADAGESGGSSPYTQALILKEHGVPAHVEVLDGFERLADCVEHGHGVIVSVNAGVLWDDPQAFESGQSNHAVVVTGVARDPLTGEIQGFFINDSGRGLAEDSGRFVDAATMTHGWESLGAVSVVTDVVRK
jgi:hypothetical protein